MKYMGSKLWMLRNGLGHLIHKEIETANRFVDLFSGSGAVAQFAAVAEHPIEVRAFDLQHFCVALANAVISRDRSLNADSLWRRWHSRAVDYLHSEWRYGLAMSSLPPYRKFTRQFVFDMRQQCEHEDGFAVTRAYGGHYFSRGQSLWIDSLRSTIPTDEVEHAVCLASLIQAASQCVASPGHTAQPFQPTRGAKHFLFESWQQDVPSRTASVLHFLANLHASKPGGAAVRDANDAVQELCPGDLVFLDPPYSDVHYSRFYHVLETIALGRCANVAGVGRYPPPSERPRSRYSMKSEALQALDGLLKGIAAKGAAALLTFPEHKCSNGLSGEIVRAAAEKYFDVQCTPVKNRFSTMGGTKSTMGEGNGRTARQKANELIFTLKLR